MRYVLAVTAVIASCASCLGDDMPAAVTASISEAKSACAPDLPQVSQGFIRRQDVNADGISDFILDYEKFACGSSGAIYCGSAGCLKQVFVSTGGAFTKVLDENVQGLRFRIQNGRPAMLLGLHGASCGRSGSQVCAATLYWNGSRFSPAN